MPEPPAFNCPSCGSPLEVRGTEAEIRCNYCGSTVLVPPELREKMQAVNTEEIVSEIETMRGGMFRQFYVGAAIWIGGFAVLFALILIAALVFQLLTGHK